MTISRARPYHRHLALQAPLHALFYPDQFRAGLDCLGVACLGGADPIPADSHVDGERRVYEKMCLCVCVCVCV